MTLQDAIKNAREALEAAALTNDVNAALDDTIDALQELVTALGQTRVRRMPELMGGYEACQELGVASGNLRQLAGLPEPVAQLKQGPIWLASSIRAFAEVREERRAARVRT